MDLEWIPGIDDIDVDMAMQKVTVMGWADQKKVLKAVRKTGRKAELWPFPYNPEYYNYTDQFYQNHYHHDHDHHRRRFPFAYSDSRPSSSYNYYKHGYNGHDHGYYHQPIHSTVIDARAEAMFSDENPNACSIMWWRIKTLSSLYIRSLEYFFSWMYVIWCCKDAWWKNCKFCFSIWILVSFPNRRVCH